MRTLTLVSAVLLFLVACDKKPEAGGAASASATASAPPVASTAPAPSSASAGSFASATPEPSAAPSASAASTKEVVVTVKDPATDKERTVKAAVGGTVTVYLPQEAGTSWEATTDKTLGKAKEQTIPGFAGPVPAHELKWTLAGPLFKAGATHKVQIVQKGKDKKPTGTTFNLTIEVVGS